MQEETINTTTPNDLASVLRDCLDHTIFLAHRTFKKRSIATDEYLKICVSPLLIRALHKAHTVNLLTKEDLLEEAECILRILLEISFVLCAIAKSPHFAKRYGEMSLIQGKKRTQDFLRGVEQLEEIPSVTQETIERAKNKLKAYETAIKHDNAKSLRIVDYAKESGLLADYYSSYSTLCSSVHSGPEDLESYFKKDNNGEVIAIGSPNKNNSAFILATAIESMVRILNASCTVFDESIPELAEVERLYKKALPVAWSMQCES